MVPVHRLLTLGRRAHGALAGARAGIGCPLTRIAQLEAVGLAGRVEAQRPEPVAKGGVGEAAWDRARGGVAGADEDAAILIAELSLPRTRTDGPGAAARRTMADIC